MPKVYHQRDPDIPEDAVYIGRPSKWGNPFPIGRDANRRAAIEQFRVHFMASESLKYAAEKELKGKDLVCWCSPKPCHGDVILDFLEKRSLF